MYLENLSRVHPCVKLKIMKKKCVKKRFESDKLSSGYVKEMMHIYVQKSSSFSTYS